MHNFIRIHFFIRPFAYLSSHTCSMPSITLFNILLSQENISLKSSAACLFTLFRSFHFKHVLNRWVSSSYMLHSWQVSIIVPLKFAPHSSIPWRARMIVLVFCLLRVRSSSNGFRVYVSVVSLWCMDFVFAFILSPVDVSVVQLLSSLFSLLLHFPI